MTKVDRKIFQPTQVTEMLIDGACNKDKGGTSMSKFIKVHNEDKIVSGYVNLDNVVYFDIINDILHLADGQKYTIISQEQKNKIKEYIENNLIW